MVDKAQEWTEFAKQSLKGSFLRKRELFKGVRKVIDDFDKLHGLMEDVEKDEKKGDAPAIIKEFKDEFEKIDDFEDHFKQSCIILLLYSKKLKEDFLQMEKKALELEKEGLGKAEIANYQAKLKQESAKMDTILGTIGAVAMAVAREKSF